MINIHRVKCWVKSATNLPNSFPLPLPFTPFTFTDENIEFHLFFVSFRCFFEELATLDTTCSPHPLSMCAFMYRSRTFFWQRGQSIKLSSETRIRKMQGSGIRRDWRSEIELFSSTSELGTSSGCRLSSSSESAMTSTPSVSRGPSSEDLEWSIVMTSGAGLLRFGFGVASEAVARSEFSLLFFVGPDELATRSIKSRMNGLYALINV